MMKMSQTCGKGKGMREVAYHPRDCCFCENGINEVPKLLLSFPSIKTLLNRRVISI